MGVIFRVVGKKMLRYYDKLSGPQLQDVGQGQGLGWRGLEHRPTSIWKARSEVAVHSSVIP